MLNDDEESVSQNPRFEWFEDAHAALASLSHENEENDPERVNRFWQAQEVEAYKRRIQDVMDSFLVHRTTWTTLEVAYLLYVQQCADADEATENIWKFRAHIKPSGGRLHEAIEKLYPPGITNLLYIEHRKVLDYLGEPTDAAQDINRSDAIAYLKKRLRPNRFFDELLEKFDSSKVVSAKSPPEGSSGLEESTNESKAVSRNSFSDLDLELIRALGKGTWKGATICEKAGRPYDNPAKPALAALKRRGVFKNEGNGYFLTSEYYWLLEE